jgi:hypothetical protein
VLSIPSRRCGKRVSGIHSIVSSTRVSGKAYQQRFLHGVGVDHVARMHTDDQHPIHVVLTAIVVNANSRIVVTAFTAATTIRLANSLLLLLLLLLCGCQLCPVQLVGAMLQVLPVPRNQLPLLLHVHLDAQQLHALLRRRLPPHPLLSATI